MKKSICALAVLTYAALALEANAQRAYAASRFALELDGANAGFLRSAAGGGISAPVIEENQAGGAGGKHLGRPVYEAYQNEYAGGASYDMLISNWIAASWSGNRQRKDGAVVAVDYKLDVQSRREFFNALITETTLPACDAASREPGYIAFKFVPEFTRQVKASGKASGSLAKADQKVWISSNFRLTIDGLDCTRIARIESFTVKQPMPKDEIGDARDYLKEPGRIEFPNLKITLNTAASQTWQDWFDSFVIQGRNDSGDEKKGALEFLSPNRQDVLFTVEFNGLGIFRLESAAKDANADAMVRTTADLYCESMKFIPGGTKF